MLGRLGVGVEQLGQGAAVLAGQPGVGAEQGEDGRGDVDQPPRQRQQAALAADAGA